MKLLTLQLFKNSIDTQEKVRLNLHSLSVSELLEYGRSTLCSTVRRPLFDVELYLTVHKGCNVLVNFVYWSNIIMNELYWME
jgi:hypothetical protein